MPKVPVISIIDDDVSVRIAISRLVRSLGYLAHAFASADEFLKSQHVNDTWCVIADVQMPGMTGIELQEAYCTPRVSSVPIIFITAFPEESIRARALKDGAVGFLSKPFDGTKLIECIDSALARCGRPIARAVISSDCWHRTAARALRSQPNKLAWNSATTLPAGPWPRHTKVYPAKTKSILRSTCVGMSSTA